MFDVLKLLFLYFYGPMISALFVFYMPDCYTALNHHLDLSPMLVGFKIYPPVYGFISTALWRLTSTDLGCSAHDSPTRSVQSC